MLKSVFLKNFVNFEEKQFLDFDGAGPYIFIGENGAGKSCVLEGIRRCLHTTYSTSFSSSFNTDKLSYFICNFEIAKDEYIISGVVAKPDEVKTGKTADEKSNSEEGKPPDENLAYYKFFLHHTKDRNDEPLSKYLLIKSKQNGRISAHEAKSVDESGNKNSIRNFLEAILKNKPDEGDLVENFLLSEFKPDNLQIESKTYADKEDPVWQLKDKVVFTFPLRSIGPLQWSESDRISPDKREENYKEAEQRCEIIRYFLENKAKEQFDIAKEDQLFKALTKSNNYEFELNGDGRLVLKGERYALLKTPEGILEAKAFSILMSGKHYKTIILEEPDRGMHPQFIERMMHLIKQSQGDKRVILTTHNTAFVTPWSLLDCFVFRRTDKECCIISGKAIGTKETQETKPLKTLRLLTSDHLSDILFAKRVLFCEGDSDFLFLKELKQQIILGKAKQEDIFKKDIFDCLRLEESLIELTIIKMSSKLNTKTCMDVSDSMILDAIFLLDKADEGQPETFEGDPGVFFWKAGDLEDMVYDMCKSEDDLNELKKYNVTLDKGKRNKRENPIGKLFMGKNVKMKDVEDVTRFLLKKCKPKSDLVSFIKFLYEGKRIHTM